MAWIEDHFGNVLLLKQKRGRKLWTLPGGKLHRREGLVQGLRRELHEETGLRMLSAEFLHYFERDDKESLAFVFRVTIKGKDIVYPREKEIETALFSRELPKDATPSLAFFWKRIRRI